VRSSAVVRLKVVELGKAVHVLEVEAGTTLADALAQLGVDVGTLAVEVRINGQLKPPTWTPVEGDIVTIVPPVRGGSSRGLTNG
jgi:sulfur carrier protein ThiS